MTPSMRWFGTSLVGLLLASTLCAAEPTDNPRHRTRQGAVVERERRIDDRHERRAETRERARHRAEVGERMQLSRTQRELALAQARAAAPIAQRAREEAARARIELREARRSGDVARRQTARTRLGDVHRSRARDLAPLADSLVASLTAEQRAILERMAHARGRTLDDERLARILARALSRPSTVPRLESKLRR